MKKIYFMMLGICLCSSTLAQELYVSTEPASNMPKNSIGLRPTSELQSTDRDRFRIAPEIMVGANKNLMLHASGYFSNMNQTQQRFEGFGLYGKYRFLSIDSVQRHFRAAAFGKYAASSNVSMQQDLNLEGDNTGIQAGLVLTQLLHKLALSGSLSYIKATGNQAKSLMLPLPDEAVSYTFSAGYLVYPKLYTDYDQPNVNLYAEFLGKSNPGMNQNYMDVVPAVQLILNSKFRIDVARRIQLWGNMTRNTKDMYLLRLEYNLFNVL